MVRRYIRKIKIHLKQIVTFGIILIVIIFPIFTKSGDLIFTRINAYVEYDPSMFTIYNGHSFDLVNVHMALNKVYIHHEEKIPAGEFITVRVSEFKKSDGKMLNLSSVKPQSFYMECLTPSGNSRWWGNVEPSLHHF